MSRMTFAAVGLSALLAGLAGGAVAGEPKDPAALKERIEAAAAFAETMGIRPKRDLILLSEQDKGKPLAFKVKVPKDGDSQVSAYCIPDCGSVSIVAKDAGGQVATERTDPQEASVLLQPTADTEYSVEVALPDCPTPTCDVGVLVMAK